MIDMTNSESFSMAVYTIPLSEAEEMLSSLRGIKKRGIWLNFSRQGICSLMGGRGRRLWLIRYCFPTWRLFSGDPYHPIPSTRIHSPSPAEMFSRSMFKWSPFTKYGRYRHDLLNHCIYIMEDIVEMLKDSQTDTGDQDEEDDGCTPIGSKPCGSSHGDVQQT